MSRRKPASTCVVCERTIAEIGGARLVATHSHAISFCTPKVTLQNFKFPVKLIRLTGNYRDVIIALFGDKLWQGNRMS